MVAHGKTIEEVLEDLFGSDTESSVQEEDCGDGLANTKLELAQEGCPQGLVHVKEALDLAVQEQLVANILAEGILKDDTINQAMWFGNLPGWAMDVIPLLPCQYLPPELLRRRPLFDQLAVNAYTPGEGLKPHIDLARFEDGICIVSLKSAAIMNFRQANSAYDVLLEPGDVLLLSGESRSSWTHGIKAATFDTLPGGKVIPRGDRMSLTFRRLCPP